jgi:4-hydroxy-tetrahydrodipicolinate synthase
MSFRGTYTAIITPFRDGKIDAPSFKNLIDLQVAGGVTGIVPAGTTGESPTVNMQEHIEIIKLAVEFSAGRIEVVAGSGANATSEAIELTQAAEAVGASGSLQVCPYYNKPQQEGLYQHFKKIAANTNLPIMLYSVPGRSSIEISVETTARLANDCKNITAMKEASGSVDRISQLRQAVPAEFGLLSGDDPITLPSMICGATGLVSVASNIIPSVMSSLVTLCLNQHWSEAADLHKKYYPLMRSLMTIDVNPVPIKVAAHLMGLCSNEFRLPLVALSTSAEKSLKEILVQYQLLS